MKKPANVSNNDWKLLKQKYDDLEYVAIRLNDNYPVQYLIGHVDFHDVNIMVNKNALIPRFETETLVEKTLGYIQDLKLENASVLEIGTGSGCISVALKSEVSSLEITAIDISGKALRLAKKNAKINKTPITFIKRNMFKYKPVNKYDILVSNPPYIKETDIIDPQTAHEPQIAIYGGADGLKYYEQIFKIAKATLNKNFLIALEIDEDAGKILKHLANEFFPQSKIKIEKDLVGKNRYLFVMNK